MELPSQVDSKTLLKLMSNNQQLYAFDVPVEYLNTIDNGPDDIEGTLRRRENANFVVNIALTANSYFPQDHDAIGKIVAWKLLNSDMPILEATADAQAMLEAMTMSDELEAFGHNVHIHAMEYAQNKRRKLLPAQAEYFDYAQGTGWILNSAGMEKLNQFRWLASDMYASVLRLGLEMGLQKLLPEDLAARVAYSNSIPQNLSRQDYAFFNDKNDPRRMKMIMDFAQVIDETFAGVNLEKRYSGLGAALAGRLFGE